MKYIYVDYFPFKTYILPLKQSLYVNCKQKYDQKYLSQK